MISYLRPIIEQIKNKKFRDAYLSESVRIFLAAQIRSLRGDKTQKEFSEILGVPQSTISSRYENPEYGNLTLQTLLDIASKLDVALVVRFVTFPDFLKMTNDFSEKAHCPASYNEKQFEGFIESMETRKSPLTLIGSGIYGRDYGQETGVHKRSIEDSPKPYEMPHLLPTQEKRTSAHGFA